MHHLVPSLGMLVPVITDLIWVLFAFKKNYDQCTGTLAARGFSLSERLNRRGKPLVQAVEFFEKAGSMGCRFIFPESDFDPSNSIGSGNLSVLTSTLIGLATESSSNKFSIAINLIPCAHCGHN